MIVCSTCGEPVEWAWWCRSGKPLLIDSGEFTLGNLAEVRRVKGQPIVRLVPRAELVEGRERSEAFRREHVCPL